MKEPKFDLIEEMSEGEGESILSDSFNSAKLPKLNNHMMSDPHIKMMNSIKKKISDIENKESPIQQENEKNKKKFVF